jgi:hypothetical protein
MITAIITSQDMRRIIGIAEYSVEGKRPSKPIFPRTAKTDALKAWMKNRSEVHGGAGKRSLRW